MLGSLNATPRRLSRPVPPRLAGLVREAWWLVLACGVGYLALALGSYDRADPGWSHAGPVDGVANLGGHFGAWLADVLLYAFGMSAWWWVALGFVSLWWTFPYRSSAREGVHAVNLAGFVLVLAGSLTLEALRLHSLDVGLPFRPGGALGALVAEPLLNSLGFTGASLLVLALMAAGLSLFSGLSWIGLMERVGALVERASAASHEAWMARRDRRAGAVAASRREEQLHAEKKRIEEQAPVRIEPQVTEIPKSERVERERQVPLFQDMPDSPLPPLRLLDEAEAKREGQTPDILEFTSRLIERKLLDFGVEVKVTAAYPGPVITRYEIEPAVGVKGSQITNLVKDLARALSVVSIRVVETIPGKTCMGLEIPNPDRQTVHLCEILSSQVYCDSSSALTLAMGKDIAGKPVVADLARMPHVMVAGTTGSGKSVAINAMILSLLYKAEPGQVRLVLVDPKMLELSVYEGIPHLLCPVVTDMKQAANALHWCVGEMERRYRLMSAMGVRNLHGFNHKLEEAAKRGEPLTDPNNPDPQAGPLAPLPYVVVVIDELADLMMVVGKKVEELIARLAQKARAAGIHLILATQRPSVDVITGLIKANIPTRVAFQVSSRVDSRTILDQGGAEALLGQGDMLYLPPGTGYPQRVHGAFVSDDEVHRVVEHLRSQGQPQYLAGVLEGPDDAEDGVAGVEGGDAESDPLYDQAVAIVLKTRRASISLVQRHLRIGYNRAARLIEAMEQAGLVSAMQSNGNREVLAPALAEDR